MSVRARTVGFVAAVLVFVVAINVGAVSALHALFPGVSLRMSAQKATPKPSVTASAAPVAARTGALPAQQVVQAVMGPAVKTAAGWRAAGVTSQVTALSSELSCDLAGGGPAPVVARSRGWVLPSGTVQATARAYSAGGGAVAFAQHKADVNDCGSAWQASRAGIGADAMAVWTGSYATLMWRRGDVVVSVATSTKGRPGDLSSVMGVAKALDARLAAALASTCVDVTSALADGARSPYVNRAGFTGLVRAHREVLDEAQVPAEALSAPVAAPQVRIPAPTKSVPDVGDLPQRPEPPVSPSALPTPVPSPKVPSAPAKAPTSGTYPEQVADPDGPGCGWAFTGQVAPTFDAAAAQAAMVKAQVATQDRLVKGRVKWEKERRAYYVAYEKYLTQVDAFSEYAAQVEKVRAAWAKIDAARERYRDAVRAYEKALADREDFIARQEAAQEAFDDAVAECAKPKPKPSPSPTPTPSVSPTPSASPTPVCPPKRPAILDQEAPPEPTKPTPPKDMPKP